jgi:hypothetical protein
LAPRVKLVLVLGGLAFATVAFGVGVVGHDRLATVLPSALPFSDSPPAWMADYANAFCGGDSARVSARTDTALASEDDVKQAFAKREWRCDSIRYLGKSAGRGGTAYLFVFHDPGTGLDNWWVFTAQGQKIVRID